MSRQLRLEIKSDLTDAQYADLANTLWMVMRSTGHDFDVHHDGETDAATLNEAWDQYGRDASW